MVLNMYWAGFKSLPNKQNPRKFQLMILEDKQNTSFVKNINRRKINNSREIKLLGIFIDNHLKLKKHIENQYKNLI